MDYDLNGLFSPDKEKLCVKGKKEKAANSEYLLPEYVNSCKLVMSKHLGAGWHEIPKAVRTEKGSRIKKRPMSAKLMVVDDENKKQRVTIFSECTEKEKTDEACIVTKSGVSKKKAKAGPSSLT